MAYPTNPNDPYRADPIDEETRRAALRDNDLRTDPDPGPEGSTSGSRIALYAVGIALLLGAAFYGFNNSSMHQAGTTPASQSAQTDPASPPTAPPGVRDVTPRTNTDPGMTTGAAPARPTPPTNNTEMNRAAQPPAANNGNAPAAPK